MPGCRRGLQNLHGCIESINSKTHLFARDTHRSDSDHSVVVTTLVV